MTEPLVFLHGYTQQPPVWQDVITECAQRGIGSKWLAPWVPGAGPRDAGFDLDAAVSKLAMLIELQAGGRATVVGLSLGGIVGLALAARAPELVSRLVVSGATPRLSRAEATALRAAVALAPASRLPGNLPKSQLRNTFRALSKLDLRPELGAVSCPTLVLVGDQDRGRIPAARELAASIPHATLQVMTGGHSLNHENPRAFADALAEFIAAPAG